MRAMRAACRLLTSLSLAAPPGDALPREALEGQRLLAGTTGGDPWTGASLSGAITWRPSPYVAITNYASYVNLSEDLRAMGAHNVAYVLTALMLRF